MDGHDAATLKISQTIAFLLPGDETFDVGIDSRTTVNDADYRMPFAFNGTIDDVTFKLGPPQLTSEDRALIRRRIAIAKD